ncbi:nuclear transport factor 2 family protein [Pendulispora rubella]|uniref:Nuclear transport factor 2 family protein n=1 Tax=Pendulispora rubella TaxID=2741070 RepID=A0ABZ2LBG3_9BACT
MSRSVSDLVQGYLDSWNETDPSARRTVIEKNFTSDCTYTDPLAAVAGCEGVDGFIAAVQSKYPGIVFTLGSAIDAHHDQVRFTWHAGPPGSKEPAAIGFDVAVLENGKIRHVFGFLDKAPPA